MSPVRRVLFYIVLFVAGREPAAYTGLWERRKRSVLYSREIVLSLRVKQDVGGDPTGLAGGDGLFHRLGGGVVGGLVGFHGGTTVVLDLVLKLLNLPVMITAGMIWYAAAAVIYWFSIRKIEVRV